MKKTIVFFSSIGLLSYSLAKLAYEYHLLLVVDELEVNNVSAEIKQLFKEVIVSHSGTYCGPIITLNFEITVSLLQKAIDNDYFDPVYIINTSEANTLVAAKLRQHFNSLGLHPDQACLFTDKTLMKEAVSVQGINTPKSVSLSHDYLEIASHCGENFIAKPTDAAGSYGVELIQCQSDLDKYHTKYVSTYALTAGSNFSSLPVS